MIKEVMLCHGRSGAGADSKISGAPMTVFIGPNNSGKSLALNEIYNLIRGNLSPGGGKVVNGLVFEAIPEGEIDRLVDELRKNTNFDPLNPTLISIKTGSNSLYQANVSQVKDSLANPRLNDGLYQAVASSSALLLDGFNRLSLVRSQSAGDLKKAPSSNLMRLMRDQVKRKYVSSLVYDALNKYLVIDPTDLGHLHVRLSDTEPAQEIELGLGDESIEFYSNSLAIDQASDGVRAFVGILIELLAGNPQIVLMDEPEAFLHPALAYKLGADICRIASNSSKKVYVATHSSSFLMGCIQSGVPINIVRLTYEKGCATSRIIPSDQLLPLMRNPLLRSTGLLGGIFYKAVVITESDADRAFYQEINERLLRYKPEWGVPNCLFINAQNKQTIPTLLAPLRELGISAAAIYDIDVLKDGGGVWKNVLRSANVAESIHEAFNNLRLVVKAAFEKSGLDMKRSGGVVFLPDDAKSAADHLLCQLEEYGVFVVYSGELESWLKYAGVSGHGPAWLVKMFEAMGEVPGSASYSTPTTDDVWEFMGRIAKWQLNGNRKGIPG